jgi:NTP pyrophosphatase (non-canonical NTP hydrolase)
MLFEASAWPGIADGTVTLTFRRWKRRQAVAGHRYRTGGGIIEADAVDVVEPATVTDADARRAGHASRDTLMAGLRGSDDLPLYRVAFHLVDEPDPRTELADADRLTAADVAEIDRRLDRLDRASPRGPWTAATLRLIAERPAVRAGDLAAELGRDRASFKLDVRKLKNLGLTLSLETGYRLSPRGAAYLDATRRPQPSARRVDLQAFQELMRSTYGERDRERGTSATLAWLVEELGELSQAVRKGDADQQRHELGDVLAWLASLADQLGLSLAEAVDRYRNGCPACEAQPCRCAP